MDLPVAFVLGGGGVLGAVQVGMLRALFRAGYRPDVVVGTSIGAVNGALVAADPSEAVTERLVRLWPPRSTASPSPASCAGSRRAPTCIRRCPCAGCSPGSWGINPPSPI